MHLMHEIRAFSSKEWLPLLMATSNFYFIFISSLLSFLVPLSTPLSNGDVFFTDPSLHHGLLHIQVNDVNWTVCYHGFNTQAADIACRELGFIKSSVQPRYEVSSSSRMLSISDCPSAKSDVNHLLRCSYSLNDCPNNESVILTCDNERLRENPYNTQVQLVGLPSGITATPSKGELRVYLYGEWGAVCYGDNGISQDAADSVCLQKGFTNAVDIYRAKSVQDVIWSLTTNCTSSESCFNKCFKYPRRSDVDDNCEYVIGIQCTFNDTLKDQHKPGSTKLCTIDEEERDLHKILVGVLVTSSILIFVIIVVILLTCYFCTRCPVYLYRKRRHYRAIV